MFKLGTTGTSVRAHAGRCLGCPEMHYFAGEAVACTLPGLCAGSPSFAAAWPHDTPGFAPGDAPAS